MVVRFETDLSLGSIKKAHSLNLELIKRYLCPTPVSTVVMRNAQTPSGSLLGGILILRSGSCIHHQTVLDI